ncbi:MAG: hypothetical protein ACTHOL_09000, partial [Luteibacter jiangsuensis]
ILDTPASSVLIDTLRDAGLLSGTQADTLHVAHADLLQAGLACTLDLRSRIAARTPALEALCAGVEQVTRELGFDFGARTEPAAQGA